MWLVTLPLLAAAQSTTYFPGETTHATLLYEDLWPARGDYDFNDVALRVAVATSAVASSQTTELNYEINVFALGASQCLGAAIALPLAPSDLIVERIERPTTGAWTTKVPVTPVASDTGSVIPIDPDLRANACGGATGFLNTESAGAGTSCAAISLRVRILTPSTVAPAPGDVFVHRCDDLGHQVHLPGYYGVIGGAYDVDRGRFGTADDASEAAPDAGTPGTAWYVDDRGIPFALLLSDGTYNIAEERVRIDVAMPAILDYPTDPETPFWVDPTGPVYTGSVPTAFAGDFAASDCAGLGGTWTTACSCPPSNPGCETDTFDKVFDNPRKVGLKLHDDGTAGNRFCSEDFGGGAMIGNIRVQSGGGCGEGNNRASWGGSSWISVGTAWCYTQVTCGKTTCSGVGDIAVDGGRWMWCNGSAWKDLEPPAVP